MKDIREGRGERRKKMCIFLEREKEKEIM